MNYEKEITAFGDWLMPNPLSTGQIALWYSLISIKSTVNGQDSFTVPGQSLQSMTGLSKPGLERAREELIQAGLIQYQKGKANQPGQYQMRPLA